MANYYEPDLARIHHEGYGFHVAATADGIVSLLADSGVTASSGAHVLDVGCGSGLLAARLHDAGYAVTAIDASPAMIELTRATAPAARTAVVRLPGEAIPADDRAGSPGYDAVVSTGHVLNYVGTRDDVLAAIAACGRALRPGGVLAFDLLTHAYADARDPSDVHAKVEDDWAIITTFERPDADHFVRDITTFVRAADGTWRRGHERHVNVCIDPAEAISVLEAVGCTCTIRDAFGEETLPSGLAVIFGQRR